MMENKHHDLSLFFFFFFATYKVQITLVIYRSMPLVLAQSKPHRTTDNNDVNTSSGHGYECTRDVSNNEFMMKYRIFTFP